LQNLVDGYNKKKTITHHEDGQEEESDEDEDENKENQHNQRLLDRLSTVAARLPGNQSNAQLLTNFNN
jgi:TATA-binding protein-associated factor Taf7